jgi:hypothetical protein
MGKPLELDGGKRVLRRQKGGRADKGDEQLFHTFSQASMQRIVQRRLSESMNFRQRLLLSSVGKLLVRRVRTAQCAIRRAGAPIANKHR